MSLTLNYTYRIYPDSQQEVMLDEWLEICRRSYNYALRELKDWIASRKCPIDRCSLESEYIMAADYPFPSYHQQQNNLPQAKKQFPLLAKVPSQVLQTNVRRLHDAWDFFRARGFGFPRFKKYGQMKSLLFPQFRSNPLTGWQIKLPKLGKVRINLHRAIPDGLAIKQVRVIKKAKGWFAVVSIQSDMNLPEIETPFGHYLGIDLGLDKFLATSDGFLEKGRKFFKSEQRKLKLLQRRLSRKNKRSNNYEKARKKVEKQHNHIAFKRKDYQFKLAHQVCDMGDSIPKVSVGGCHFSIMSLPQVRIILVEPAGPLNVGSVARVMKNMALERLILVNPQCDPLSEPAKLMAVHGIDVLEQAQQVSSLPEALQGCQRAIATTARPRTSTSLETPKNALPWLLTPNLTSALIFGPEDRGLSNEELNYAQRFVCIPSNPEYPSLNLAQSVAVCTYELYQAAQTFIPTPPEIEPASLDILEGYYQHLESFLLKIGYLYPHTATAKMEKFRKLYNRANLSPEEVALLRGIVGHIDALWNLFNPNN